MPKDRITFPKFQEKWLSQTDTDYKIESQLIPAFEELANIESANVCISTQSSSNLYAFPQTQLIIFSLILLMLTRFSTGN